MNPKVCILMGSLSDRKIMRKAAIMLQELDIPYEMHVLSAHRVPDAVKGKIQGSEDGGIKVFIAGAGMAAHLAGVVASHTILPVIGVPLSSSNLDGQDALYSTVQMPPGIPVATVAINGAKNAAILAAQIIGLQDEEVLDKLKRLRESKVYEILRITEHDIWGD